MNRRSFLQLMGAAPAVILTPGLLMRVKPILLPPPVILSMSWNAHDFECEVSHYDISLGPLKKDLAVSIDAECMQRGGPNITLLDAHYRPVSGKVYLTVRRYDGSIERREVFV